MLADVGQVQAAVDADLRQLVLQADAGQQQELRRADGTGRQHDLARGGDGLHVAVSG